MKLTTTTMMRRRKRSEDIPSYLHEYSSMRMMTLSNGAHTPDLAGE
jgi:hypothetical protein